MFEDLNRFLSVTGIDPVVNRFFSFAQAADAHRNLESASHFGKVVIEVARYVERTLLDRGKRRT